MRLKGRILWIMLSVLLSAGCSTKRHAAIEIAEEDQSLRETRYYSVFTEATKHSLFGNNKTAIPYFKECIRDFPDRAAPYYQLSTIYLRENDPQKALWYSRKAYLLEPENKWYKEHLANIYQYQGRYDSAVVLYEEMMEENTGDEQKYNLALLYAEIGDFRKSLSMSEKVSPENQESYEILMLKHSNYHKLSIYDSAVLVLRNMVELFADGEGSQTIVNEYLAEIKDKKYLAGFYKNLIEGDSTDGYAWLSYADYFKSINQQDSFLFCLEKAFNCRNLTDEDKLDRVIELISEDRYLSGYSSDILNLIEYIGKIEKGFSYYAAKADLYIARGEYENAKPVLDSLLFFEKNNFIIWEQTIRINSELGLDHEVISIGDEAIDHFPEKISLYLIRANSYYNLEMYDSVIRDMIYALELEDMSLYEVQIYNILAESYRELGQHIQSDEYFEKILEIDEFNRIIRNNYAYYLALRGEKLEYALQLSKYTVEREPLNPTYLDTYGWILFKLGNFGEASNFIKSAISNGSSRNPEVLEHYGDIMVELGRCKEALEAYEKVVEIEPSEAVNKKIETVSTTCN